MIVVASRPLRVRTLLIVAVLALAASLLSAVTALADHPSAPAVNGQRQSYKGVRVAGGGGGGGPVATDDFFFHGQAGDQANKASYPGTATFDGSEPTELLPDMQTTSPFAAGDFVGNPLAAYWVGDFAGTIAGDVGIRWFWSSANPLATVFRADVEVTFFADPDGSGVQPATIIGRQVVPLTVGPAPTENISVVPVSGAVTNTLVIQVRPINADTGQGLQVSYDAEDFASSFGLPVGGGPGGGGGGDADPQSTPAAYNGPELLVQAVDVGRDSAEPTIGVNKNGSAFFAAGAFDSPGTGLARTKVMRSTDGGRSWKSIQIEAVPGNPDSTIPPTTLDPYVYVEEDFGRLFNPELYGACSYLQYSDDEGETFEQNPAACGDFVNDHQTLFAGPPPTPALQTAVDANMTAGIGYPEIVYYCFNRVVDASCGRSVDGGLSFTPTAEPAFLGFDPAAGGLCGGLHGHVATDPKDGTLYLPKGHCGFPWIGISDDGGDTWERVQVSEDIGTNGIQTAVDVDDDGNLFYVWWDEEDQLPYMATSTDQGQTWSDPLMIAPPGVHEVNFPTISAGSKGRVAITFPGTKSDDRSDKTRPWNSYLVLSRNALAADPLFISTTANPLANPIHRGDCQNRCAGMFDFLDVIVSPHDGAAWATATDTCTEQDNCATNPNASGNNDEEGDSGASSDMRGIAIRQISGPMIDLLGCRDRLSRLCKVNP